MPSSLIKLVNGRADHLTRKWLSAMQSGVCRTQWLTIQLNLSLSYQLVINEEAHFARNDPTSSHAEMYTEMYHTFKSNGSCQTSVEECFRIRHSSDRRSERHKALQRSRRGPYHPLMSLDCALKSQWLNAPYRLSLSIRIALITKTLTKPFQTVCQWIGTRLFQVARSQAASSETACVRN